MGVFWTLTSMSFWSLVSCKLPADVKLSVVVFSPSLVFKVGEEDEGILIFLA
jgi:hypothetical protein